MTFQLTKSVAEAIRKVVRSGQVASGNAFVEEAVIAQLRELRREHLAKEYERAANDPEFMHEMEEIDEQFDVTTGDGLEDK